MIKISILVAVYNSEKFLKQCLDSLTNQTMTDIEIICVNDGSTDNSENILNEFLKKDKRIQVYNQENKGASAARNLGIDYCHGEYICMVDSDDFLELDCLEKTYLYAKKNNLDASIFKMIFYYMDRQEIFKNVYERQIILGKEAMKLSLSWKIPGVGLYKNKIIKELKYDESNSNGDELSTRKFLLNSLKVGFSTGQYFYRYNLESISKRFSLKQFDILENRSLLKKFLIDNKIYFEVNEEFEFENYKILIGRLIVFYKNKFKLKNKEKIEVYIKLKEFYKELDLKSIESYSKIIKKNDKKIYFLSFFKENFYILSNLIKLYTYLKK